MHEEINIGDIIISKLKEQQRSIAWLARQVYKNDANLGRLLKNNNHIHSELLLQISIALKTDFFAYYSERIKNYIPL
jgi:plasmid maintenance system antidote protein VapI